MYVNECSLILLPDLVVVMLMHKQRPLTNLPPPPGVSLLENKDKEEPPKNRAVFNLSQIIVSIL